MTPEEAYEEALRRIREAEETGAVALDLSGRKGKTGAQKYTGLATLTRLPPEIAGLTSLQSLNLASCQQLSGDLSPLARLTSLQMLDLRWCDQLSDFSPLSNITSLQTLDLSVCKQLSGNLSLLSHLTSLQKLRFLGCAKLSGDLCSLSGLASLQSLDLSRCNRITGDLSPLANLTSLQSLNLSRCNRITGDLSPLANLVSLRSLDLSGCKQLSGDLSPLADLTLLQTLNLSECKLNLSPLSALTSLRTLNLEFCNHLTDFSPLGSLISLQTLDLSGCRELSGDLSPLTALTSLQELKFLGCAKLSGDLSPLTGLASLRWLDLIGCEKLIGDLSPLTHLTSLQTLDLSGCEKLIGDLSPLTHLISLQTLDLSGCVQLNGLSSLTGLVSLHWLNMNHCLGFHRFAPFESMLPILKGLSLFGCKLDDLPPEICGEEDYQNVLDKVRAHYEDLESGQRIDAEVKVLFLGNGGVGKTQLCRRLRDGEFDPNVPTTHGIQLGQTTVELDGFPEPVRLNLWDFGGQDIYHSSHALFLQGQAIFLLLWTPELECQTGYQEGALSFRHRPLSYWLDFLRAFAGKGASALIVQSQCDTARDRAPHPHTKVDDFSSLRWLEVSAKTGLRLNLVKAALEESVRDCFERRPPPPIGAGRVKVRDRLRQMLEEDQKREPTQRQHRLLERSEFDRICEEAGGVSDHKALLDFLHHNGVVFYRSGLFSDRIVLDQNWALEAIYALFDRKKILPLLRGYGRFCRADLERLIWSDYTAEEQKVFLGMMESCGICFRVRELPHQEQFEWRDKEWEYIAPELLPEWSDAQELLLGRLRNDPPNAEATARYAFLHEGVLRGYLSKLGAHAKDAAIYWQYGCWFFDKTTHSQVLIESQWDDAAGEADAGTIRLRAWGENAESLIDLVLDPLRKLPIGQAPKIKQTKRIRVHAFVSSSASIVPRLIQNLLSHDAVSSSHGDADLGDKADGLSQLQIAARPELPPKGSPEIFVSYAWGDDSSKDARNRTEVVDRLCETLDKDGWNILRDSNVMHPGELISGFMKRIGLADHVIVVLSDKYLRSPYCMTELYSIYQRTFGEKVDFLRRIIPLVLDDARFGTWRERLVYTKHWRAEFEEMELHFKDLGEADFRLYKATQEWHNRIGDMLAYVNDILVPHGFDEIVKDDFAALRQMLKRRR